MGKTGKTIRSVYLFTNCSYISANMIIEKEIDT